ncbi:MAG: lipopolysaccharide biosynthesis protein [Verrucomicrobia bacterium]|nr:lipopolysaccharide biosynthesis protein [Verrucomicrobiota bacterium]MBI3869521.1 lipopolysaccharide biosynthesis protein [Verrucomicrobiota bacterium]
MSDQPSQSSTLGASVKWSMLANLLQEAATGVITFVLAALLTPRDFGLVSTAGVYLIFAEILAGLGLQIAIIQTPTFNRNIFSSVFWTLTGLSGLMSAGIFLGAGWVAGINRMPELEPVMRALALLMPLGCASALYQAVHQRDKNFKALAIRSGVATTLGGVVGVGMAVSHYGVWALVGQRVTTDVISLFTLATQTRWHPRLHLRLSEVKPLLPFSSKVLMGQIGVGVQGQMDALLLALFFGPTAVGLYRLADRLVELALRLVTRSIQNVALTHFAALQGDPKALKTTFLRCIRISACVTIPIMIGTAVCASPILRSLGSQWIDGSPALAILCAMGAAKALTSFTGPLLQAVSRPGLASLNVWGIGVFSALGFWVAKELSSAMTTSEQVTIVAACRTTIFLGIYLPANLVLAVIYAKVSWLELGHALKSSLLASLLPVLILEGVQRLDFLQEIHPRLELSLLAALGLGSWIVSLSYFDPVLLDRIRSTAQSIRARVFQRAQPRLRSD